MESAIEYRDIPGKPGYRVGSDGSVWSRKSRGRGGLADNWHILKVSVHSAGYLVVGLRNGAAKTCPVFFVHRLVLESFVGPCPEGMECRHLDGNPQNAALANLSWGTPDENGRDRIRHGTQITGSRVPTSKLTESDIPAIRQLRERGLTQLEIGMMFNVAPGTISAIERGVTWKSA